MNSGSTTLNASHLPGNEKAPVAVSALQMTDMPDAVMETHVVSALAPLVVSKSQGFFWSDEAPRQVEQTLKQLRQHAVPLGHQLALAHPQFYPVRKTSQFARDPCGLGIQSKLMLQDIANLRVTSKKCQLWVDAFLMRGIRDHVFYGVTASVMCPSSRPLEGEGLAIDNLLAETHTLFQPCLEKFMFHRRSRALRRPMCTYGRQHAHVLEGQSARSWLVQSQGDNGLYWIVDLGNISRVRLVTGDPITLSVDCEKSPATTQQHYSAQFNYSPIAGRARASLQWYPSAQDPNNAVFLYRHGMLSGSVALVVRLAAGYG